jgi:hypothetical protein
LAGLAWTRLDGGVVVGVGGGALFILSRGWVSGLLPFTLALSLRERGIAVVWFGSWGLAIGGVRAGRLFVLVFGIVHIIVEFGMGLGEGLIGNGWEKFFERHAGEPDAGVRKRSVGVVLGVGFGASFGFPGFAHFKELFGDADFGHELGDFGAGAVSHETEFGFHFVKGFGGEAVAFIGEELFVDVRALGPFQNSFSFLSAVLDWERASQSRWIWR